MAKTTFGLANPRRTAEEVVNRFIREVGRKLAEMRTKYIEKIDEYIRHPEKPEIVLLEGEPEEVADKLIEAFKEIGVL